MRARKEGRIGLGVESLEGRRLTAAMAGPVAPRTAEVRMASPSVGEIVVTKDVDCASTNLSRTTAAASVSEIVVTKALD
jgi:hypothetical protein